MSFKIDDQVVLSQSGEEEYSDSSDNPHHEVGIVADLYDPEETEWCIEVFWENGGLNVYKPHELQLYSTKSKRNGFKNFARNKL